MTSEFQPPPRNMVQEVRNIIEGYKMGSLRALAQDPVQNSLDAYSGAGDPVRVEFRLEERTLPSGEDMFLLTVTDNGTTGLRGSPLSLADLQERAALTGFLELSQDENWAAWEAMFYTKTGEDKLGSRGQGKAAFLYHSRRALGIKGPGGIELEGMVMLYDTLLEDGTYRLGVRLAQPADLVLFPPYEEDVARQIVRSQWRPPEYDLVVPLGLEPLTQPGTRVIVPFLSQEAVKAFRSGEMMRWLQRCWWRTVQTDRAEIRVVVDGVSHTVDIPACWRDQPWLQDPLPENVLVKESEAIEADGDRRIKRIVLLYDPTLVSDEIEDVETPQYEGVQLLRGQQWIETIGTQHYADYIPSESRPGFRGFVEFDRQLEVELREVESPQHDAFHRQRLFVRQIRLVIGEAVKEFAAQQGWLDDVSTKPREDRTGDDVLRQITELFIAGSAVDGRGDRDVWTCKLNLDYPSAGTTRVDWKEVLTGISAECSHTPRTERREVRLSLVLVDPMGDRTILQASDRKTLHGSAGADFRDVRIVKVGTQPGDVECPMLGRYRLRAECYCGNERVATASRNVWVRMDPPSPPQQRPISVDIQTRNTDADRVRINNGEHLDVAIVVKNRGSVDVELKVIASLEDLLLRDDQPVSLPGRLVGDQPSEVTFVSSGIEIRTSGATNSAEKVVMLEPGRHLIRVDLLNEQDVVEASAARSIWVEENPEEGGPDLPFSLHSRNSTTIYYPVWELVAPHADASEWVLEYTTTHPVFQAALLADAIRADGRLAGRKLFFGEMICGALIEWAISRYREHRDEEGLQLLLDRAGNANGPLWERYRSCLEALIDQFEEPLEVLRHQREAVSLMLYVFQEGGGS